MLAAYAWRRGKPVRNRRGRATVIGGLQDPPRSQIPRRHAPSTSGTHDPEEVPALSDTAIESQPTTAPVPVASPGELLPYAVFAGVILLLLLYFVGAEEGAASVVSGTSVHEFVHDARHLLGFPCH
jgi:hypothetical protein